MENIRLSINSGSSSIIYVRDSFDDLYPLIQNERELVLVIDKNVDKYYGDAFSGLSNKKIIIETSEKKKTLKSVDIIVGQLLDYEVGRGCLLLGVGGGITTDIVGFVASIYKRGVRCAYVSTSLVGQVDASFGGKTGVNYAGYKNVVGAISQPLFSYLNTSTLKTLPQNEYKAGIAEMLKTFVIADRSAYQICISYACGEMEKETFEKLLTTAIRIKSWIVEKDEKEKGERRLLNFGHTFGHAIEKCSEAAGQTILHGEAVSIGMVMAAKVSNRIGIMADDEVEKLKTDLHSAGLPTECNFPVEALLEAIKNDKKREGNSIHFVLVKNIGSAFLKSITIDELAEVANDLC